MGDITLQLPRSVAKSPYLSKWNILFDKINCQWISFKPQEGHKVYPCYSCRDMFGSKSSFIDHVNRRGMLITYRCVHCGSNSSANQSLFRFYNPCSFMLHVRKHFTSLSGILDLDHVSIATLPIDLAGFLPHPSVPLIYDVEEDQLAANGTVNTRFYSPIHSSMGQRVVNLTPNVLLFQYSASASQGPVSLVLKAISSNIPRCQFVLLDYANGGPAQRALQDADGQPVNGATVDCARGGAGEVKSELVLAEEEESNEFLEKASEEVVNTVFGQQLVASGSVLSVDPRCTECRVPVPGKMLEHMIGENRPCDDRLKCATCNYVAPTRCSLSAHRRIHLFQAPFVCPECGRQFATDAAMMDHLDGVCFHMAKQVRFRCNGRNCGKIFAQSQTFSSHFMTHMPSVFKCTMCSEFFFDEMDLSIHANVHATYQQPRTFYMCLVCKETDVTYTVDNYMEHINWHCTDPAHRVYILICKYCRSYFRSPQTYAAHLLRCAKRTDDCVPMYGTGNGTAVNSSSATMIRYLSSNGSIMGKAMPGNRNNSTQPDDTLTVLMEDSKADIVRCVQCQETCTLDALVVHMQHCKARHTHQQHQGTVSRPIGQHTIGADRNQRQHNNSNRGSNAADRKRKQRPVAMNSCASPAKVKKSVVLDVGGSLQPTVFDGTYVCKICGYKNTSRTDFQEHIVGHRHVSTAYQCMECGECFLVKPSLVKHLRYFHQIADTDGYLVENECCDQEAVTELVASINRGPLDRDAMALAKEPLRENQCRVCRLQCDSEQGLNKHFRVHGMAFIGNRNVATAIRAKAQ